jgi:hypothetical protein
MQDAMRKVEYVGGAWRNDLHTTSVVLTPLTPVNKGQVKAGSVNPDRSVNGVNEVNVTWCSTSLTKLILVEITQ